MTRALSTLSASIPEASDPADTDTWGATTETLHEAIDRAVGGDHEIATTGGTTDLSDAQNDCLQLFVTGTLVSNAIIEVKARPKVWLVRNETSGSYTVTFRVDGGAGASVVVNQGKSAIVHTDGADCFIIDLGTASGSPPSVSGPVEYPDGTEGSPSITNTGDTNTGIFFPDTDAVGISTGGSERMRFDASGYVVVGYKGAGRTFGDSVVPKMQVHGTNAASAVGVGRFSADALPAHVRMAKSRNATAGSHTVVVNNDVLGAISFDGSDGTNFIPAAQITGIVNGTPGTNDMPGALIFSTTADGGATPAESMRLDANAFLSLDGDTDTGLQNGGTNILNVYTGGTLAGSFDASQRLLLGATTAQTLAGSRSVKLQVAATGATAGASVARYSNDSTGPYLSLYKSRGAAIGTNTGVNDADELGTISFEGADSAGNRFAGATIQAYVADAVGAAEMPGGLIFSTTPNASTTLTEAMRINDAQQVIVGGLTDGLTLTVAGDSYTPKFQIRGQGMALSSIASASDEAAVIAFAKGNGGLTQVDDDETLGIISWSGYTDTGWANAALIKAEVDGTPGSGDIPTRITFWTSPDGSATPVEAMRITQAGKVIVGAHDPVTNYFSAESPLQVLGTSYGTATAFLGRWSNDNAGASLIGYKSRNATVGSHTVVQNGDVALRLEATVSDGTNPKGVAAILMRVDGTPGTNDTPGRIEFYTTPDGSSSLGLALTIDEAKAAAFVGAVSVGSTLDVTSTATFDAGVVLTGGQLNATRDAGTVGVFNRTSYTSGTNTVVSISINGSQQGDIAYDGSNVLYRAFCGAHWSQMVPGQTNDIPLGTIVDSVAELATWEGEENLHLPCFKVSDVPGSKAVYGVYRGLDEDGDASIASLGATTIRIAAGQTPAIGDYIESDGNGCGRVQADDILRASTVAKVTSTAVAATYPDGSFLLPCTLHCG
jgi:hypothetical protein